VKREAETEGMEVIKCACAKEKVWTEESISACRLLRKDRQYVGMNGRRGGPGCKPVKQVKNKERRKGKKSHMKFALRIASHCTTDQDVNCNNEPRRYSRAEPQT
jgi:hypothetical protein